MLLNSKSFKFKNSKNLTEQKQNETVMKKPNFKIGHNLTNSINKSN